MDIEIDDGKQCIQREDKKRGDRRDKRIALRIKTRYALGRKNVGAGERVGVNRISEHCGSGQKKYRKDDNKSEKKIIPRFNSHRNDDTRNGNNSKDLS